VTAQLRACVFAVIVSLGTAGTVGAGTLHVGSNAAWGISAELRDSNNQLIFQNVGDGGGNFSPGSTFDGQALPYMYCVDLNHDLYLNGDYYASTANNAGYIWNNDPLHNPNSVALTNPDGSLTNAGNIGYLLAHFAQTAVSIDQQLALQSAIWTEVYGNHYTHIDNPNFSADENATIASDQAWYLSHVPTGGNANFIGEVLWINPSTDGVNFGQGQVAYIPTPGNFHPAVATPEASTFVAMSIMLGLFGSFWVYKRSRQTVTSAPVSA
jgi:hypothetical protein